MDISTGKPQKSRHWSGESVRQTDRQTTGRGMQYSSGGTSSNALLFIRPESALSSSPLTGEALSAAIKGPHAIYARISQMNRRRGAVRGVPDGGPFKSVARRLPQIPAQIFFSCFSEGGRHCSACMICFYSCEWD